MKNRKTFGHFRLGASSPTATATKNVWASRGARSSRHYRRWLTALSVAVPVAWARSKRKKINPRTYAAGFLRYASHEVTNLYGKRVGVEDAAKALAPLFDSFNKGLAPALARYRKVTAA